MVATRRSVERVSRGRLGSAWLAALALIVGLLAAVDLAAASEPSSASVAQAETAAGSGVAAAVDLSTFQPGNIIGDAVFFNRSAMGEAQIQAFLQAKVPTCQKGYTCLKDWYDTSRTTTADAMCAPYAGGVRERASRIIHKVAQACGINPQVLIVMLQKEQGLVTHTWPSTWRYTIAMGQGCPDTAACDTRYYGFFNQVYGAAWQLKRYANPPGTSKFFTWYAPGKTWNVRFHPKVACGTSPVLIQNQATADLYYYTPYQPNRAALRAGYGTGDACSSYGNRNFFNYFTEWFGSTQYAVTGVMNTEWQRRGGATGQLGQPTSASRFVAANGGGHVQNFERGAIWRPNAGTGTQAFSMGTGPFFTNYQAAGAQSGAFGWPQENPRCGLAASGCAMKSTSGTVYYSAATASQLVLPAMDVAYAKAGGPSSSYGYPSGVATRGPDASQDQRFQTAHLVFQSAKGLVALPPAVAAAWKSKGGINGRFGYATASTSLIANGGGAVYEFKGGTFYSSPAGIVGLLNGPFRANYVTAGGPAGAWGWPTGAAACGQVDGGCLMTTQKGTVAYSPATASVLVGPRTARAWLANGGPAWLGYPKAPQKPLADGFTQVFQKGTFYISATVSVGVPNGGLLTGYVALGGPTGPAGWPTAAVTCGQVNGGCLMSTANGTVAYSAKTAAQLVPTPLATAWLANGGPNWLGYPIAPAVSTAGGLTQDMERGRFYAFGGVGVGLANGPFGLGYKALGGPTGAAGWPTAPAKCGQIRGGCLMPTVNGIVAYSPLTGTQFVRTAIRTVWEQRGGAAGALGYPLDSGVTTGVTTVQRFEHGKLTYNSTTGAVTVG